MFEYWKGRDTRFKRGLLKKAQEIKKPMQKIATLTANPFFPLVRPPTFRGRNRQEYLFTSSDSNPKGQAQEQKTVPRQAAMTSTMLALITSPHGKYWFFTITCKTARGSENVKLPMWIFKKFPQIKSNPFAFNTGSTTNVAATPVCTIRRQIWISIFFIFDP
jgi:hypothetical protein